MANWGIYGFPNSETQAKRRFFNGPPHLEIALAYYSAESAFKDAAMTQPCSHGDAVVRLADWGPVGDTMSAFSGNPTFVIDYGFPCIQTNGIPLIGSASYSAQFHFAVFRAPGSTFDGFGSCLGTVPNGHWPYLWDNGDNQLYTSNQNDTVVAAKNGQVLANPYGDGALAPINQRMLLFVESNSSVASTWYFGQQGPHHAPLYIYEAANFAGLTDEQVDDITNYLMNKYSI